MSVRFTAAVLLAGLSLTASAHAEDDLLMSERFLVSQGAEAVTLTAADPAASTSVHAEIDLLGPEYFLDPQATETAAMIAVDLAMVQEPAAEIPASAFVDLRPEPVSPIEWVNLAPSAEPIETVSLAPEFFLDRHADETLAWIAEDLASAGELTTGSVVPRSPEAATLLMKQPAAHSLTDDALSFQEYLIP